MSDTRPDIDAGPIERKCSESNGETGVESGAADDAGRPNSDWPPTAIAAVTASANKRDCFIGVSKKGRPRGLRYVLLQRKERWRGLYLLRLAQGPDDSADGSAVERDDGAHQ